MHVLRVPRIIWNGEIAITDCHLTLPKWQGEVTQLVQQTAKGLEREQSKGFNKPKQSREWYNSNTIVDNRESALACSTTGVLHDIRPTF